MDVEKPKTFIINLNEKPENRWNEVIRHNKNNFRFILNEINSILATMGKMANNGLWFCGMFNYFGSIMYKKELEGISRESGIPMKKLILMQICYEMFSACTSCVFKDKKGKLVHFRTMDWEMDFLKDLTVNVEFVRDGKTIFKGVTWAGYVGIATGMSATGGYSVALNYRRSDGTLLGNFLRTILMKWPISYLVRYVLENELDYKQTKKVLSTYKLISPCYITLCSGQKEGACVIVRDCGKTVRIRELGDQKYIVQTNCDNMMDRNDIMWSKDRIRMVRDVLNKNDSHNKSFLNCDDVFDMFLGNPVINAFTIYKSVIVPSDDILETYITYK
jgi:hypothetical protein